MTQDLERELKETRATLEEVRAEYHEFAYIVSHDLRSVFRQVEGFTNIVAENNADSLDDKTKRHFELILSGSERGKAILDALLVYSRLNTRAPSFETVDCQSLLAEILKDLSPLISRKQAKIDDAPLPTLTADRELLSRVFNSLIVNGLTYHDPSESPQISIQAAEQEAFWQFSVADQGMGISDAAAEKVFKVLRRGAHKGYESFEENMGMGLACAKKIIDLHGGRIGYEPNSGAGTTFTFTVSKTLKPNDTVAAS